MVRVRFAPSPTGYLHVGGARTALYCYLFARKNGGQFVLRVEDTDEERSTDDSMRMQLRDLAWLEYKYDEGIHPETLEAFGSHGPYRQSQRKHIYKEHAEKLIQSGRAYYCFLTDEEIEKQREAAMKESRPHQVVSPYRDLPLQEALKRVEAGEKAAVRFKVPDQVREFKFTDLVRGEVTFPSDMVGDFVILRSGGMPVYNFCCVIDDALMKISHVLRAEEHLSNTLRQLMLYEAFGYKAPEFGHLSIILGPDRQKLSKRHGATSVGEYKEKGYLPEALTNFIALLGWSSPKGQEILSMNELIEQFSLDRLHAAAAVFDEAKLKWMNAQHLRALPNDELWKRVSPFFAQAGMILPEDRNWQSRSLDVFKTSMETLVDAVELYRPFAENGFEVSPEGRETMTWAKSKSVVESWKKNIEQLEGEFPSEQDFQRIQDSVKSECGVKGKEFFMPIRVAVLGKPHGAELKIVVPLLGKKTLIRRAQDVLSLS